MLRAISIGFFIVTSAAQALAADDVALSARSVVRVILEVPDEDGQTETVLGTGFAIAKTKIVTNAHVVEIAETDENARIRIVPSAGGPSVLGRLIYIDPSKDLAVLDVQHGDFAPATLGTRVTNSGQNVSALGYPASIDQATLESAGELLRASPPNRSAGVISGFKRIMGIDAVVHTAGIARGSSGGPLLDDCGLVIGVNTFLTNSTGETNFAFAISGRELSSFLAEAEEPFEKSTSECVAPEEQARRERDEALLAAKVTAALKEENRVRKAELRERAVAESEDARENYLAFSLALLLTGGSALVGSFVTSTGWKRRIAFISAASLIIASVSIFVARPTRIASLGREQ